MQPLTTRPMDRSTCCNPVLAPVPRSAAPTANSTSGPIDPFAPSVTTRSTRCHRATRKASLCKGWGSDSQNQGTVASKEPRLVAPQRRGERKGSQNRESSRGKPLISGREPGLAVIDDRPTVALPTTATLSPGIHRVRVLFVEPRRVMTRWVWVEAGRTVHMRF